MPFRNDHSCMLDDSVIKVTAVEKIKTKYGVIRLVMGVNSLGKKKARSMRIPGSVPVVYAQELCKLRGGKFSPATPIDPKRQVMSEGDVFCLSEVDRSRQKEILERLVEDFEMPDPELMGIELSKWRAKSVNDLPDSAFIVILRGGKKDKEGKTVPRSLRLLPYKNADGKLDKAHIRNALARVNQVKASPAVKRRALAKLMRIARGLGMKIQEKKKFKLSDLDFYLGLLERMG